MREIREKARLGEVCRKGESKAAVFTVILCVVEGAQVRMHVCLSPKATNAGCALVLVLQGKLSPPCSLPPHYTEASLVDLTCQPCVAQGPRYSIAFFNQANENTVITSPGGTYPPITGGAFVKQAMTANFETKYKEGANDSPFLVEEGFRKVPHQQQAVQASA